MRIMKHLSQYDNQKVKLNVSFLSFLENKIRNVGNGASYSTIDMKLGSQFPVHFRLDSKELKLNTYLVHQGLGVSFFTLRISQKCDLLEEPLLMASILGD